jgi:hypothetical protein
VKNPFPFSRHPYWKGYDKKEDECLAEDLLYGKAGHDKTGRLIKEYLVKDSPEERLAIEALIRLLTYWTAHAEAPGIVAALGSALRSNGVTERRLVFQFRKKGKRSYLGTDYAAALHVESRTIEGWPKEAAVHDAMKTYRLSRKGVFDAIRRVKKKLGLSK